MLAHVHGSQYASHSQFTCALNNGCSICSLSLESFHSYFNRILCSELLHDQKERQASLLFLGLERLQDTIDYDCDHCSTFISLCLTCKVNYLNEKADQRKEGAEFQETFKLKFEKPS